MCCNVYSIEFASQVSNLNLQNVSCFQTRAKLLGFVVENGKLHYENPTRLENVPFPENLLQLRSFLGAVNFSRGFYKHFFCSGCFINAWLRKCAKLEQNYETLAARSKSSMLSIFRGALGRCQF